MSAVLLLVLGLGAMGLGYLVYSKFIAEKVFRLTADFQTPAHEFEDGVDFVPTNRYVLWGHHFTSVAGAAPIVGPAIAVIWGWLPAFLWVVLGTIFFAGIHDAGAVWASVRNRARSVGALTGEVVGARARSVFMIVIFLLLLMVNAVFAVVIAGLMMDFPSAVVPVWGAILVALVIGQLIYRRIIGLGLVSLLGVLALYALIGIGPSVPVQMPAEVGFMPGNAIWILILFGYAAIASLLPVWMLLQPRDYINGLQLFIADHPLRRDCGAQPRDRCARHQQQCAGRDTLAVPAVVRDHRLRRHFRVPWSGRFGHHLQAAQQREGCALRRLLRCRRRRHAGAGRDPGGHRRLCQPR